MRPQTRAEVRGLLERHGVSPTKRYGQNFLVDPNIVAKIAALVPEPGAPVVEIGPGTGALTAALLAAGHPVRAYEIDESLGPLLEEVLGGRADIRFADATRLDLAGELEGDGWWMVANLPYNVGTPILLDALRTVPQIRGFIVMVQQEVAERLVAPPGTKDYGVPSVVVRLFGEAKTSFRVPPQVFLPRPNVDSAVVVIERVAPPDADRSRAADLAQAAFAQRRKMLRSSLRSVLDDPEAVLSTAGISPTARAEELDADDFLRLAREVG